MFKSPIRKVKAAYVAAGVVSVLGLFGIAVDKELHGLIENGIALIIPLVAYIPTIVAYYAKNNESDQFKIKVRQGK